MTRNYHPGDVAMVQNEYGIWNTAILQVQPGGNRWVYGVAYESDAPTTWPVRPLAIIDPEDRVQVERLAKVFCKSPSSGWVEAMQVALLEYVDPKPQHETVVAPGHVRAMLRQVEADLKMPYWSDDHADILDAAHTYLQSLADHLGVSS